MTGKQYVNQQINFGKIHKDLPAKMQNLIAKAYEDGVKYGCLTF